MRKIKKKFAYKKRRESKPIICIENKDGATVCFCGNEQALGCIVDGISLGAKLIKISLPNKNKIH